MSDVPMRGKKVFLFGRMRTLWKKKLQPGMTDGEEYKEATGIKIEFKMS